MCCHGPMFGNDGRLQKDTKMKTRVGDNSKSKPSGTEELEQEEQEFACVASSLLRVRDTYLRATLAARQGHFLC